MSTIELVRNTDDLSVIHRAFRREFGWLPDLVTSTEPLDVRRARRVAAHADDLIAALHRHHSNEDELLWPRLAERATLDIDVIERMERQHGHLRHLLDRSSALLAQWRTAAELAARGALADVLREVSAHLDDHLAQEEVAILQLVRHHITTCEWDELGERSLASIPRSRRLVFLGHMLEQTSDAERHAVLTHVPASARLRYRLGGIRRYRKEITELYGGPR